MLRNRRIMGRVNCHECYNPKSVYESLQALQLDPHMGWFKILRSLQLLHNIEGVQEVMMFSPPPCKDCDGRYIGCHNENACPAWQEWKSEEKRKNEELEKTLSSEKVFKEMHCEKDTRICRRKHNAHARGYRIY